MGAASTQRSPQLEHGHLRIANELFDAITAHPFKQTTLRVLLAVLRKTYGYGKKEDDLSASQLAALCGRMSRQHVTTALNELAALRVIHKRPGLYGCIVGLNKDYAQWLERPVSGQAGAGAELPAATAAMACGGGVSDVRISLSVPGTAGRPESGQAASPAVGPTTDNLPSNNPDTDAARVASAMPPACQAALQHIDPPPPPVATLPLADGSEFGITPTQAAEWSAAYPSLDLLAELLRMRAWLRARPQNLKTRRGIRTFIVGWLNRSLTPRAAAAPRPARKPAHGSFSDQDYRAGVAADGSF
ncbi:Replication protein O [plant metagenome]|uniref:Replication protein O n=1 Tax=plant metagenome TaxID=1297885 RepID=A0A484U2J4_9ZZZZ